MRAFGASEREKKKEVSRRFNQSFQMKEDSRSCSDLFLALRNKPTMYTYGLKKEPHMPVSINLIKF
jgi:hypothetical protein